MAGKRKQVAPAPNIDSDPNALQAESQNTNPVPDFSEGMKTLVEGMQQQILIITGQMTEERKQMAESQKQMATQMDQERRQMAEKQAQLQESFTNALQRLSIQDPNRHQGLTQTREQRDDKTKSKKMEMPHLEEPKYLTLEDFRDWKDRFHGYADVSRLDKECSLQSRRVILKSALSKEWTKLWNSGVLKIKEEDDIDDIMKLLSNYLRKKRNSLIDRTEFYKRQQGTDESVDQYYAALCIMYENCAWTCKVCTGKCNHEESLREERLRDQIICGMIDAEAQQKLFTKDINTLTLEDTLTICNSKEFSRQTKGKIRPGESYEINRVNTHRKRSQYKKLKMRRHDDNKTCSGCGGTCENETECPARTRSCNNCGKLGHYATVCRSKTNKKYESEDEDDKVMSNAVFSTTEGKKIKKVPILTSIKKEEHTVQWIPDTGAEVNIISEKDLHTFKHVKKEATSIKIYGPGGNKLECTGKVQMSFRHNDLEHHNEAYVIRGAPNSLLGVDAVKNLEIIRDILGESHIARLTSRCEFDDKKGGVEMEDKLRQKARQKYESRAKDHEKIEVGNFVRVQHKTTGRWNLIGQVVKIQKQDQIYLIRTKTGRQYLRHKKYLRLLREGYKNNTRPEKGRPCRFTSESVPGGACRMIVG